MSACAQPCTDLLCSRHNPADACEHIGCGRRARRDMFLRTCWRHATHETKAILAAMVASKVVGKDPVP